MFTSVHELEQFMSIPQPSLVEDMKKLDGNFLLLGVGGKMGPTLAYLLKNALRELGSDQRVIGAARFSSPGLREELEANGIETISVDLLDDEELKKLPREKNVIYMAGNKFGTKGNEHFTWAMNSYLPGRVAEHFVDSRIVVFSTGNVYPFVPIGSGGATEEVSPNPIGEYGQSSLGRERVFTYFSHKYATPMSIFRLNYAIDMRYGVLVEVAKAVWNEKPLDVTMGYVNVIWQGDANAYAIRSLLQASSPPVVINATGPETLSIRWLAYEMGKRMGKEPILVGEEADSALLNNAGKAHQLFGYPSVSVLTMLDWIADWMMNDRELINKPTHFQEREGQY